MLSLLHPNPNKRTLLIKQFPSLPFLCSLSKSQSTSIPHIFFSFVFTLNLTVGTFYVSFFFFLLNLILSILFIEQNYHPYYFMVESYYFVDSFDFSAMFYLLLYPGHFWESGTTSFTKWFSCSCHKAPSFYKQHRQMGQLHYKLLNVAFQSSVSIHFAHLVYQDNNVSPVKI